MLIAKKLAYIGRNAYTDSMRNATLITMLLACTLAACGKEPTKQELTSIIQKDDYHATVQTLVGDSSMELRVTNHGIPVDIEAIDTLEILHVTIVSADLQEFYHAYSGFTQTSPGTYQIPFEIQKKTAYTVWLDIPSKTSRDHHGAQLEYRGSLGINSDMVTARAFPEERTTVSLNNGKYIATLLLPEKLYAGGATLVPTIKITSEDGTVVEPIASADHFYVIVDSTGEYRLEHINQQLSKQGTLAIHPLVFQKPGIHSLWAEIYIQNGQGLDIIQPQFYFSVRDKAESMQ